MVCICVCVHASEATCMIEKAWQNVSFCCFHTAALQVTVLDCLNYLQNTVSVIMDCTCIQRSPAIWTPLK